MLETYPTGRAKNFIHGIDYQKLWLMLFFRRAVNRKYFFRLATEMSSAAGFDDIVFRHEQNGTTVCMLIQVKHKQDDSKKICVGDLLTKSGELNLVKHFAAFLEIRGNEEFKDKIKDFFIVIDVDFDYESLASKGITVEKIETQDEFLNIGDSAKYKLRDLHNNIAQYLGQGMSAGGREVSDEEIRGFLNELVFVVNLPNDVELEKLIRNEINDDLARRFKYFGDNGYVFNALFAMMSDWMKDKRGRFLTPEEGEKFFREVEKLPSTLSELEREVKEGNKGIDKIAKQQHKDSKTLNEIYAAVTAQNNKQIEKPIQFNVEHPVEIFVGRGNELQEIYDELHESTGKLTAISQIVVIGGLGGIGKSELARKYAYKYGKDYDGNVIWINAETQKDLGDSFKGLARELNRREGSKISTTEGVKSIIEDVYRYFEDVKSLFIFDNAEGYKNISEFLPSSLNHRPHVLITSRDIKWEVGQKGKIDVIELDVFEEPEVLEFVKKSLNIDNTSQDEKIEKLAEELQYLPLALKQAVAYIHNKNKESELRGYGRFEISDYLKEYQRHAGKLLKEGVCENEDRYTETVSTTWNITITYIQKEYGFEALNILEIMAYLAPDDICIKEIFSKLIADDKEKLWSAVELLNRYSMINLREGVVNIHRLVQKVTGLNLQKEGKEEGVLRKALELINSNDVVKEDVSHIVSVWEYASKHGKLIDEFYFNSVYVYKEMFVTSKSNPLHLLAESGSCKAIKAILTHVEKHHLDKLREVVNIENNCGITSLHLAAGSGRLNVVKCLVSKGANIHAGKGGYTPIYFAACFGRLSIVRYLAGKGADANVRNIYGGTALHRAAYNGRLNVVKYLVNKGADINANSVESFCNGTPLHCAVHSKKPSIVRYLLDEGADIGAEDEEGKTPLYRAAGGENLDIVKCLVEAGADICAKIKSGGMVPLYAAAKCGSVSIIKYFVSRGININIKSKYGNTMLHIAAGNYNLNAVKYLIGAGASINARNKNYETPLHDTWHVEVVEYLISEGAYINARDKGGNTPLHLAAKEGNVKVAAVLLEYSAKLFFFPINAQNNDGTTASHYFVDGGELHIVRHFIRKSTSVSSRNKDGNTPLHLAAMKRKIDVVKVLLKHNADVNAKNNEGKTALHYATDFDHRDLVELLLAHGASIL